jgi:hypothetical protein
MIDRPNQSAEPTAIAVAVENYAASRRWLSFFVRRHSHFMNKPYLIIGWRQLKFSSDDYWFGGGLG